MPFPALWQGCQANALVLLPLQKPLHTGVCRGWCGQHWVKTQVSRGSCPVPIVGTEQYERADV